MPRRGPHGGGRGGKEGGGGGDRETTISKAASYVLRHGAAKEGVHLDQNGFANVADLVGVFSSFGMEFLEIVRR